MSNNASTPSNTYSQYICALQASLGITAELRRAIRLPLYPETPHLVAVGHCIHDRPMYLFPAASNAWHAMEKSALEAGVTLQLVSSFRSVEYQAQLIRNKLQRGQHIQDILKVNAPPGHSEHHTGRAVDLTTPGCQALEEEFADSDAFRWLNNNANSFGFYLSYPRNNPFGIIYEPWHWAWYGDRLSSAPL